MECNGIRGMETVSVPRVPLRYRRATTTDMSRPCLLAVSLCDPVSLCATTAPSSFSAPRLSGTLAGAAGLILRWVPRGSRTRTAPCLLAGLQDRIVRAHLSTIGVAAMAYGYCIDRMLSIEDLVDDPPIANADTPEAFRAFDLRHLVVDSSLSPQSFREPGAPPKHQAPRVPFSQNGQNESSIQARPFRLPALSIRAFTAAEDSRGSFLRRCAR